MSLCSSPTFFFLGGGQFVYVYSTKTRLCHLRYKNDKWRSNIFALSRYRFIQSQSIEDKDRTEYADLHQSLS